MAFPPGFLDELRSRISLPELVGRRVRLVRKGREYGGLCPFHNEKTPSFYVVEDKGFFHCFGCGAHGDAIGYAMRADNLDFIEAVERLAGEAGIAVPQQTPQDRERAQQQKTLLEALAAAAAFYEERLRSPVGARGREYLAARGLDEATIRRFRLGWAPEDRQSLRRALGSAFPEPLLLEAGLLRSPEGGGAPYDYFRGRVIFPIGDRAGRVIAFGGRTIGDDQPKYLNSPDTPLFEKGRVLYAWAAARANTARDGGLDGPGAIVTEGYMDVIALHRAGFGTAVAPLGTALTEFQLQELWRLSPEPVLCFDGDTAGQRAALRALHRALPLLRPGHSLRFAALPAGEDPDSLIRTDGSAGFAEVLASARPLSEVLWQQELSARPIDTPERRADFERRLMEAVGLVVDRGVQGEYRRHFRERLFQLGRTARPVARGGLRPPGRPGSGIPPSALYEGPPPPPRSPGRVMQEVRLRILLQHPFLIGEAIEDIVHFDFADSQLDRLRRAILEAEAASSGLDAETLRQHLCASGFAATVDAILSPSAAYAGVLPVDSDPSEVRREWMRITAAAGEEWAAELQRTIDAVAAEGSAALLEQIDALTLRKLEAQQEAEERLYRGAGESG